MNNDLTLDMKIITNSNIDIKAAGSDNVDLDVNVGGIEVDPVFTNSPAYTITYEDITEWDNKSDFSGSYTDLTDKPTIPTKTSQLNNDSGFITNSVNNLINYTLSSNLANIATSGSYTDLTNKPNIPTKTSQLNNDSGFITNSVNDLTNYTLSSNLATVATSGSYTNLTDKPTIPTKTSELNNDSGFITNSVNDLTNYTLSNNLATVATSGSYTDLIDKPTIPTIDNSVSTSSTNGVENQAITNYVDGKISNTAGNSQTIGYSQEYINNYVPLKLVQEVTGQTVVQLPAIWNEVVIICTVDGDPFRCLSFTLPYGVPTGQYLRLSYYGDSNDNANIGYLYSSDNKIQLIWFNIGGAGQTLSNVRTQIYYR